MAEKDFRIKNGLVVGGHIIPDSNLAYDLGDSAIRFRDLYISGNTIDLGGAKISQDASSGTISLVAAPTLSNPNPSALVVTSTGNTIAVSTSGGAVDYNAVAAQLATDSGFNSNAFTTTDSSVSINGTLTVSGITFPTSDGTNGQVIATDGNGTLSFTDASGGGGGGGITTGKAIAMAIVFG